MAAFFGGQVHDQADHQVLGLGIALGDEQGEGCQPLLIEGQAHPLLSQIEQEEEGSRAFIAVREGVVLDHEVQQMRGTLLPGLV